MTDLLPIRRELLVDLDTASAFELFTTNIGEWWPVATHSVFGAAATVGFADGRIVESADGERSIWGTVTEWEPGALVTFTWHPGRDAEHASHVRVSFTGQGPGQTLVVLEHSGWEVFDDPAAARSEYYAGWQIVLGRYGSVASLRRGLPA